MVPMAPSATMTRVDNWSRNSWARVLVDVVMRSGRKCRWKRGKCDMFHFTAGGKGRAVGAIPGDLQGLLLQPCRQKEPGSSAQGLNLGLYQLDPAIADMIVEAIQFNANILGHYRLH